MIFRKINTSLQYNTFFQQLDILLPIVNNNNMDNFCP